MTSEDARIPAPSGELPGYLVHDCKREVTDGILGSEVARLVRVIGDPYHEPSARDARGRILEFFEVHLRR